MDVKALKLTETMDWTKAIYFIVFTAAAVSFIALNLHQLVTGTIVNMLLILAVEKAGKTEAIFLGMITPIAAAMAGVLPLPIIIMVPFIALANAVFVTVYDSLKKNPLLGVSAAAALKFSLLAASVAILVYRPITLLVASAPQAIPIPPQVAMMMTWPQLVTALLGGGAAFIITSMISRPRG